MGYVFDEYTGYQLMDIGDTEISVGYGNTWPEHVDVAEVDYL